MAYYHVLLRYHDSPNRVSCLLSDLSEKDLRKRFIKPYRSGKSFFCKNEVVEVSRIQKVMIVETEKNSAKELKELQDKSRKEIQEFNRSSDSLVLISPGRGYSEEDIIEMGQDVTAKYVFGPPGRGTQWIIISDALNHPWISAIGTGLIVAALVWWFGWN